MEEPTTCPACGHDRLEVFYMAPLRYECKACGHDFSGAPIRALTLEEAVRKRPELYSVPKKNKPE